MLAAMDLFWRQGYTATGIAQIVQEAGVLRGSLYHYFPTKEDLLIATLEYRKVQLGPAVVNPVFERVDDPIERVFGILDGYRQLLLLFEFRLGCPIGNLALELGESHPRARKLLEENFDGWTRAIRGCFEEARGRLPEGVEPADLAEFALVTMEGAVMVARTYRSIAAYDTAVTLLRDYVDRLLSDGTTWAAPAREQGDTNEGGAEKRVPADG